MNYQALFAQARDRKVRVGLVGLGDFGRSLITRCNQIATIDIVLLCDQDEQRIASARHLMSTNDNGVIGTTRLQDAGYVAVDVMVEATGNPHAAVDNALFAFANGQHVVMVSKEADSVVGPYLHHLAKEKGLVYSAVDGDQPSLLIGLISWAHTLGLEVIAAGKASEYDFVVTGADSLNWRGEDFFCPGIGEHCDAGGHADDHDSWTARLAQREAIAHQAGVPTRTVPDFCELGLVANATGMTPDTARLNAPILRTVELADVLQLQANGGILTGGGKIEVFNCLRRANEESFAGGVFVVVACDDRETWTLLQEKGHKVARNGQAALLYNPQHLLGIEAPVTILSAALLGLPTGAFQPRPICDVIARTQRPFSRDEVLDISDPHHHAVAGLAPELTRSQPISGDSPCPYYLAVGQRLRKDVPADTVICCGMLDLPESSSLYALRRQQDAHWKIR